MSEHALVRRMQQVLMDVGVDAIFAAADERRQRTSDTGEWRLREDGEFYYGEEDQAQAQLTENDDVVLGFSDSLDYFFPSDLH